MDVTKLEAIQATKRANNRLKPVSDAAVRIISGRGIRTLEKEQKLMLARLDRELTEDDTRGRALRDAVDALWQELSRPVPKRKKVLAKAVYTAVRRVQRDRWRRIEARHGKIRHYFDGFGQIKDRFKSGKKQVRPIWPWLVVALIAGLLVWWLVRS